MPRTWFLVVALAGCSHPPASAPVPASTTATGTPAASPPTVLTEDQVRRAAATAPEVAHILAAYENFGGVLSPGGDKLAFRSDRSGIPALYLAEVGRADAPAIRIAGGTERVGSVVFTHDGAAVVFRQDTGADENFHIYRVATDGTGLIDLTPGDQPLWRDSPLLPRDRDDVMIYAARTATDYASMVFVQELAGHAAPRLAYRDAQPGTAIDVSPDGTRALWIREAIAGGHELLEVELATGAARPLAPLTGRADVTTAAYATDGTRVYVATDHGTEAHAVVALDLASRTEVASYPQRDPATAQIAAIVPSPRGDRVAIMIDAGNRSFVRELDARTLAAVADVAAPLGTATLGQNTEIRFRLGAGTFTPDGARFVIGLSTPDAPDDLYLVHAATGAVTPLRHEPRPGLDRLPAITASIEQVRAFDGLSIPVNVYLPAQRTGKLPTIVVFHGGPDASTVLQWNAWTRVFTTFGFAVIEPNIRGSTGFGRAYAMADDREKRADSLDDIAQVNRWARRQPWCDPDRLVIEGGSYGGYLVLMGLTRQPALWRAGVDLAGITDLTTMLGSGGVPTRYLTEFGDPIKDAALIARFSPLRDAAKIRAPVFIYQGQNDPRVPRDQADAMVRALRDHHIPVEYMVPSNEGHTVAHRENQIEFLTRVIRFLSDELHLPRRAP
jgi:dipeptidyl aminopeptidase/acylaminoacyl peptidase